MIDIIDDLLPALSAMVWSFIGYQVGKKRARSDKSDQSDQPEDR